MRQATKLAHGLKSYFALASTDEMTGDSSWVRVKARMITSKMM